MAAITPVDTPWCSVSEEVDPGVPGGLPVLPFPVVPGLPFSPFVPPSEVGAVCKELTAENDLEGVTLSPLMITGEFGDADGLAHAFSVPLKEAVTASPVGDALLRPVPANGVGIPSAPVVNDDAFGFRGAFAPLFDSDTACEDEGDAGDDAVADTLGD